MEEDLFDLGMDSLVAIRARNAIQRKVKFPEPLRPSVVFENPTPSALAKRLWAVTSGEVIDATDLVEEARKAAKTDKAALSIPGAKIGKIETILLTGATGSLGAHVLAQLVTRGIKQILCPVRATSDRNAVERIEASQRQRKSASLQVLSANTEIECFASDLSKPDLGLASDKLNRVRSQLDATIHAAWPVNFNLPFSSFTPHPIHH